MDNMINIPIEINSDKKGYFDRQCPNKECEYVFKVNMEDWKEKISDEVVYCPMCGYITTSDNWNTDEQVEKIKEMALSWAMGHVQGMLNDCFKKLEKNSHNNKFMQITYKPGRRVSFINNPIGQREEWALDITCEECGTRYSVIGSAYFCPCCGHNAIEIVFEESLDTVEKQIISMNDIKGMYTELYGIDKAETMCRTMREGTLGDIVSAFQKFAETRFTTLSSKKVRVNDFQRVDDGSNLFQENIGKGYDVWLTTTELDTMRTMFQRRHILEHNNGIIDSKYIEKSGDTVYSVGQRLVVKDSDTIELLRVMKKLGEGLKTLTLKQN